MKRFATIFFLMLSYLCASAQNAISVKVPGVVALNEQFNVTFIIDGTKSPSSFSWEAGDDFQLVWGPQRGSSSSISIINGKTTKSSQTTYTYILMPRSVGKFQLPSATAEVDGQSLSSRRASVEVVSDGSLGGSQSAAPSSGQDSSRGAAASSGGETGDIFIRLITDKKNVMVGEPLTATLKLYQRANISGFEDAKFPDFKGFWSQETASPQNIEFHRESIGDKIYNTAVLRSWSLTPQQAGDMKISSAELVCLVNVIAPGTSTGSIFDSFFQDEYQTVRKRVVSPQVSIKVNPLPSGAPASFGGGVGTYRMDVSLATSSFKAHEASSLRITVSGKGNVSMLEAPVVNFPPDFEIYDVKTQDISGGKTFEYPFIPRSHGDFKLGPVEYSYYDLSQRKYVTLISDTFALAVEKGEEGSSEKGGELLSAPRGKSVKVLGDDIRYISTALPSFRKKDSFFLGSTLFIVLLAFVVLGAPAVYFICTLMRRRRSDVAGSRNRSATKMARRKLSLAGDYLHKGEESAFYEELHRALLGFVSDKLNISASAMNKENIKEQLVSNGVIENLADEFIKLVDACEFARYSPSGGSKEMNQQYENAVNLISAIDSDMKNKHSGRTALFTMLALAMLSSSVLPSGAQDRDSLWTRGVEMYSAQNWSEAARCWQAIVDEGYESDELYCNLGDARFKDGNLPGAILCFERALRINPSNQNAKYNLEYANSRIQDRIESVPEFFLESWGRKACYSLPSDVWAVMFIVFLAAAASMLLLFFLSASPKARKIGFSLAILAVLASLLCLDFAAWQRREALAEDKAIITSAVVPAKSSPESGTDLFVLHEGTKITLKDNVGDWFEIKLADGRQGWINISEFEKI